MATKKQRAYAEARGRGLSRDQSAIMAGYHPEDVTNVERSDGVQQELAKIRAETAANTGITKEQVVELLIEAARMAQTMEDPTGLVAAARELGKMLGYYAPEVKKTLHGLDKEGIKKVLDEMSDEELIRLRNAKVIDGTSNRVPELGKPEDVS